MMLLCMPANYVNWLDVVLVSLLASLCVNVVKGKSCCVKKYEFVFVRLKKVVRL